MIVQLKTITSYQYINNINKKFIVQALSKQLARPQNTDWDNTEYSACTTK